MRGILRRVYLRSTALPELTLDFFTIPVPFLGLFPAAEGLPGVLPGVLPVAFFAGMAMALGRPFFRDEPGLEDCWRCSRFLWTCDIVEGEVSISRSSLRNVTELTQLRREVGM